MRPLEKLAAVRDADGAIEATFYTDEEKVTFSLSYEDFARAASAPKASKKKTKARRGK